LRDVDATLLKQGVNEKGGSMVARPELDRGWMAVLQTWLSYGA